MNNNSGYFQAGMPHSVYVYTNNINVYNRAIAGLL